MHTTMQTLGQVAIIGGGIAVSLVNILLFRGTGEMTEAMKAAVYIDIYKLAMLIPAISVLGVVFAAILKRLRAHTLRRAGMPAEEVTRLLNPHEEATPPTGGSSAVVSSLQSSRSRFVGIPYNQEIIFAGSMGIVLFLMAKLLKDLSRPHAMRSSAPRSLSSCSVPYQHLGPVRLGGRSMSWVSMNNSLPSWP